MSPDYRQLWEDKSGQAPQQSVIAGLQRLINQRQDDIIEKDAQINALKSRIQEYNELLVDMEKQYRQQQEKIRELEGDSGIDSTGLGGESSSATKIKQLQAKINEMQNKLFIYTNLPSRITDLEQKLEEKDKTIDEYVDRGEDLRKRLSSLAGEAGADAVISELESKIEKQKDMIKQLRQGRGGDGRGPAFLDGGEIKQIKDELARHKVENEELKKQLTISQNTIENLQSSHITPSSSTSMSTSELNSENIRLKNEIEQLRNNIREKDVKLEEIIEKVQKGSGSADVSTILNDGQIKALETKIERLKAENQRMKEQLAKPGAEPVPTIGAGPSKPTLRPTMPKIREISPAAPIAKIESSENTSELKNQLDQLKKDMADKEQKIHNLNFELADTQKELAQLKSKPPSQPASPAAPAGKMADLLQDLQIKNRKLQGMIKQKDAEIERLKNG